MKSVSKPTRAATGERLLLSQAQKYITRQIFSVGVLLVASVMVFNAGNFGTTVHAGNTNDVTTNIIVSAGALELANVETAFNYTDGTAGVASTVNGIHSNAVVRDFRSSPGRWALYMNSSNVVGTDTNYWINSYNLTVNPSVATLYNLGTFNNKSNAVVSAADDSTLNGNIAVFTSSHNATGAFGYNGLLFNASLNASLIAQTYQGTLKLTVLATT